MAIDTAARRFSIMSLGRAMDGMLFPPDGSVDIEDRYSALGLYAGNIASAPVQEDQIPNLSARFDSGAHEVDMSFYFSGGETYAIDPAVETGWTFDTDTGLLTIDTDDEATFGPYTVTATNTTGSTESNAFTVKVSTSNYSRSRDLIRKWW